jgi:cardiolipin synthase
MTIPLDHAPRPRILVDGEDTLAALLRDIDGARRTINFSVYIWKEGRLSDRVLDRLIARQRAGVKVRILLDGYGGPRWEGEKFDALRAAGGKVETFHALSPMPWSLLRNNKRSHRRAIVIDSAIGYAGGWAIQDVWLGRARNPEEWHDFMFRVEGAMAERLEGSFAELWAVTTGEVLVPAVTAPVARTDGAVPFLALSSSPSPGYHTMESFFLFSLLAAREEILLESPYFLPNATMRKVLTDKARSGVKVSIILPNDHTDQQSVRWAGQRIYGQMLEAGVRLYEYQPTFTHAKLLVVDGAWSVIGSANTDIRSRQINAENVIGVQDAPFAQALAEQFRRDLARSKEIRPEEWQKRGPVQRVLEIASQALVQQY